MSGTLYLVPTPVGNLEDITLRALRVLKEVDLILAEDTRTTGVLLKHYEIGTPMRSHHKFNEHAELPKIICQLEEGNNIALVTDAGTPGISDPGFLLSRECVRNNVEVVCLPGATAFVPALVASGLPCDKFVFEGFLPPKKGRATRLNALADDDRSIVIYESPKKLPRTLQNLAETFGEDRQACVCREISKLHESYHRGSLKELISYFSVNQPKGEIVIIVEGKSKKAHSNKNMKNENNTDTE